MDPLTTLGVALGLATLTGLNLYLTVFVTGLAIRMNWLQLASQYENLQILAEPAIIVVAGILYFAEFFADKIPWVDSVWDSVHTVIRPVGGALIAIQALGDVSPVMEIIVALLGGGMSLTTHTLKAGTRVIANGSPEPLSNVALSVGEDLAVLGGLGLIAFNPIVALTVFVLFIAAIFYFAPKMLRALTAKIWLIAKKLNQPAEDKLQTELHSFLPADIDILFRGATVLEEKVVWAVPCISGKSKRIDPNLRGYLIATAEQPKRLYFVAKTRFGKTAEPLELDGYKVSHEPKFICEQLVLYTVDKGPKYLFIFDRPRAELVKKVAADVRRRLEGAKPAAQEVAQGSEEKNGE